MVHPGKLSREVLQAREAPAKSVCARFCLNSPDMLQAKMKMPCEVIVIAAFLALTDKLT